MSSDEFVVTPWNVEGDIDYDKLTKQFGTQKISPEILSKIKKITGEDHFMLRRGIFFSHRDLNVILDNFENLGVEKVFETLKTPGEEKLAQ